MLKKIRYFLCRHLSLTYKVTLVGRCMLYFSHGSIDPYTKHARPPESTALRLAGFYKI